MVRPETLAVAFPFVMMCRSRDDGLDFSEVGLKFENGLILKKFMGCRNRTVDQSNPMPAQWCDIITCSGGVVSPLR